MCRKSHIVCPDGRFWRHWVARCILRADERREVQRACGDEISDEAEDVDYGKCDGGADCGVPPDVENNLGVEGEGPGEGAEGRVQRGLGNAREDVCTRSSPGDY